jgi:hypothetical protein
MARNKESYAFNGGLAWCLFDLNVVVGQNRINCLLGSLGYFYPQCFYPQCFYPQ